MKVEKGKLYAVVTGDIVNFSKLPGDQRKRLDLIMKEGSKAIKKTFKGSVPMEVDVFRGDSWQLLVTDLSLSLEVGLFLRAHLRASMGTGNFDTRLAIGIGTVDYIPDDRVSKGDGEAFRNSGEALERMKKGSAMNFRYPGWEHEESINVMLQLIDVLAKNWSDRQALAITGALRGLTQEEIGRLWKPPIKQQSVNGHLQRAGWFAIEKAIEFYKKQLLKAVT
jgi:hypothetical protein